MNVGKKKNLMDSQNMTCLSNIKTTNLPVANMQRNLADKCRHLMALGSSKVTNAVHTYSTYLDIAFHALAQQLEYAPIFAGVAT